MTVCDSTRLEVAVSITVTVFLFYCFIIQYTKAKLNSVNLCLNLLFLFTVVMVNAYYTKRESAWYIVREVREVRRERERERERKTEVTSP